MCRSWNSSMAWQHVGLPVIFLESSELTIALVMWTWGKIASNSWIVELSLSVFLALDESVFVNLRAWIRKYRGKKLHGPKHEDTLDSMRNLAQFLEDGLELLRLTCLKSNVHWVSQLDAKLGQPVPAFPGWICSKPTDFVDEILFCSS